MAEKGGGGGIAEGIGVPRGEKSVRGGQDLLLRGGDGEEQPYKGIRTCKETKKKTPGKRPESMSVRI